MWLSAEAATSMLAELDSSLPTARAAVRDRYGVSDATIKRWIERVYGDERKGVTGNAALAQIVEQKKAALREQWEAEAVETLRATLRAMARQAELAHKLDRYEPEAFRTLAGGAKLVGELVVTERIVHSGKQPRDTRKDPAPAANAGVGARAPSGASTAAGDGTAASTTATGGTALH
ncbi:MAG: hypothetical protein DIU78_009880 [Pseudomonadota bacterium]